MDRILKRKILNKLNSIKSILQYEFVYDEDIVHVYERYIDNIIKYEYPVYCKIKRSLGENLIKSLMHNLKFNNNAPVIIVPFWGNSKYWIKLAIGSYSGFLSELHQDNSLIGNTIIDVSNKVMYDIEIGEEEYEVRRLELNDRHKN